MMKVVLTAALVALIAVSSPDARAQQAPAPIVGEGSPNGLEFSELTRSGVWQLRIYTINRDRLDDFVAAWREGVYPLRLEHGFQIPAAWLIRDNNQFVWILGYDGPENWEDKQSAYYNSPERRNIDVDPLQWIAHGDSWFITPIDETR